MMSNNFATGRYSVALSSLWVCVYFPGIIQIFLRINSYIIFEECGHFKFWEKLTYCPIYTTIVRQWENWIPHMFFNQCIQCWKIKYMSWVSLHMFNGYFYCFCQVPVSVLCRFVSKSINHICYIGCKHVKTKMRASSCKRKVTKTKKSRDLCSKLHLHTDLLCNLGQVR